MTDTAHAQSFRLLRTRAGQYAEPPPSDLESWFDVEHLDTVAKLIAGHPTWPSTDPSSIDQFDWWFDGQIAQANNVVGDWILRFDGLATDAEVWLDDRQIGNSQNMFVPLTLRAELPDQGDTRLCLAFRSIAESINRRRPRPRWKTALVQPQALRTVRTSLLGYTPSCAPAVPVIGPWRALHIEPAGQVRVDRFSVCGRLEENQATLAIQITGSCPPGVHASVAFNGETIDLPVDCSADEFSINQELPINGVNPWWPNGYGKAHRYLFEVTLKIGEDIVHRQQGHTGFREVSWNEDSGFTINGVDIFCRGACWTTLDPLSPGHHHSEDLRRVLKAVRDSGANMLRVPGIGVYESSEFLDCCDEFGLLIWQDFMFANMDYSDLGEEFVSQVSNEVDAQLDVLAGHPCLTALCGGSELEQQPAMLGLDESAWKQPLFHEHIAGQCAQRMAHIPYFTSSPTGGDLPFHNDQGIAHYFGVGAYLRAADDALSSGLKFATECLGFSNVPEESSLVAQFGQPAPACHLPAWKAGVPRDNAAGWDFEDVRDHYLEQYFSLDVRQLRYRDQARYLELSRVITGELMALTFSGWRSGQSPCNGALIWNLVDTRPGAGWGIFDQLQQPKSVAFYLKRVWSSTVVLLHDEGLNGHWAEVINDSEQGVSGTVRFTLLGVRGSPQIFEQSLTLPARQRQRLSLDGLSGRFSDSTASYGFGPAPYFAVAATLLDSHGSVVSQSVSFPDGHTLPMVNNPGLDVTAKTAADGVTLTVQSDQFLQSVVLTVRGHQPQDNYFHLLPGQSRIIRCVADPSAPPAFRASLRALNLANTIRIAPPENV